MVTHDAGKQDVATSPPETKSLRLVRTDPAHRPAGEPEGVGRIAPLPTPPGLAAGPDASALWKGFRRRWPLALCLGVAAAIGGFFLARFLLPEKVRAFALLQVSSARPSLGLEAQENRSDFPTFMKTQAARIKSRDVLMRTLDQDPVRNLRTVRSHPDTLSVLTWLEENLKVEYADGSELMTVSLIGEDAGELKVLVQNLTQAYLSIYEGQDKSRRRERVKKMEALFREAKDRLGEKVAAREAIARGHGAKDTAAMVHLQQAILGHLTRVQEQHFQIAYELEKKNLQLAALEASRKNLDKIELPDSSLRDIQESDPILRQEVAAMGQVRKIVDRMVAEGHPPTDGTLRQFRKKLDGMQVKVDERSKELQGLLLQRMKEKGQSDYNAAVASLQIEIVPLQNQMKKLQEKMDSLTKESEAVGYSTAKDQLLQTEIERVEKTVADMGAALDRLRAEEESDSRVRPVGEAEIQPLNSRKRLMMLILAPLALLGLCAAGVSWWESSARRITTTDEVDRGLALPVVGTVPVLSAGKPGTPQQEEVGHCLIESIDALRTMLLRTARHELTRVVMVTSAVEGEGKTTLASNLALSLARVGKKTLLLDCDLRGPAVHQLFEHQLQPGFSEALLGEVPLNDAVRATGDPNLWILPAGCWDREVIQELAKSGLEHLFERLKEEFDFVVVDSHPVLPANDSVLIGQQVDLVLLSLMREQSQAGPVFEARKRLASLGIDVFGAVVNGMPLESRRRGKYVVAPAAAAPEAT